MCPHGYHHSGSMATPAHGTRDIYRWFLFRAKSKNHEKSNTELQLFELLGRSEVKMPCLSD